ncbi:MAG TPA: phosphoenolpyruvate carboxykinase (ATP) [Polyangiaceae bacterium]
MSVPLSLPAGRLQRDLPTALLAQFAVASGQCRSTRDGALVLKTGRFTGRAPQDRYVVEDEHTRTRVEWGARNLGISQARYQALKQHLAAHLAQNEVFEVSAHAGGPEGMPLTVFTTSPAHALFSRHLFQSPRPKSHGAPGLTLLHAPECLAVPERHGTRSETFIVLCPTERLILIGGTGYAGEIKKSVFSVLNYLLPERNILPMHAAVNVGEAGDSAVFFGLSGTGKTTLSADAERFLVGDDEHGWSDAGLFNLEGGCYAKTVDLSAEHEPEIWRAVHREGVLLENVALDPVTRDVDFHDRSLTENTRAAYPLSNLARVTAAEVVPAPRNVIFLTADAFGVLPPLARLSLDQTVYYFLSGYTAKLAGTELNQLSPQPTFSTCFGSPFMPRPAVEYAALLRERVLAAGAQVWLVNTGWIGGPYGEGRRMPIADTRRIVRAILNGELVETPCNTDPWFGLHVPRAVPGVAPALLDVRASWRDPARYDEQALKLSRRFDENFATYRGSVSEAVVNAGPFPVEAGPLPIEAVKLFR